MAVLLSCALLFVSSAPVLSAACTMTKHEAPMCSLDGHAMAGLQHDIDAQDCFIECGCGCHSNIDSLPHQFAPHTPAAASAGVEPGCAMLPLFHAPVLTAFLPWHDDPPPEFG